MRGRLAYICCSLDSSASRLAIWLDNCELSKSGAGVAGLGCALLSLGLGSTLCGLGAVVTTADFFGVGGGTTSGLAAGGGVILLILLSWNGASSVVLGTAFLSRVPLPCWLSWAWKSAFSGGFSLLKVARVMSMVWRISAGLTTVKPTPRISARCTSAARNRVKPSRSAGRTRGGSRSAGTSAGSVIRYPATAGRGSSSVE